MKKSNVLLIIVVVFAVVSLLTYLNYNKILNFFTNKEWEIADSIDKIEIDNYIGTFSTSSNFFTVTGSGIQGYSENAKKFFDNNISFKDVISYDNGEYAIVAEKNATYVCAIYKNEKIWDSNINNANILGVSINKNGYSAVIYSQAGYKSLIRVFSNKGDELFTSYLASTYAIDIAISNDNKMLAIAEIDTNGVSLVSSIKLINMQSVSENDIKKIELENGELISNIEYNENNQIVILTDSSIKMLNGDTLTDLIDFKENGVVMANIENPKEAVIVCVEEEGLFSNKCYVGMIEYDNKDDIKKYEIEEIPSRIVIGGDVTAVDTGNKIIFLDSSRIFYKKMRIYRTIKRYCFFK